MASVEKHINVCICTFQRTKLLGRLLRILQNQQTGGLFTYSITVVDNDKTLSAKDVVIDVSKRSRVPIQYLTEPERSIPRARNLAVKRSFGDSIAFIDDDEFPKEDWLLNLYRTQLRYGSDGVLGPVLAHFDAKPPQWIIRAGVLEKKTFQTGTVLPWEETRTGNVLLKRGIFNDPANLFNPEFRHGEDKDFYRRMTAQGRVFIWCAEAPVYETLVRERFKISYFLRRALLRGGISQKHFRLSLSLSLKSMMAFMIYTLALPWLLLVNRAVFMKYLIKDCDHIGRLMMACGIDISKFIRNL